MNEENQNLTNKEKDYTNINFFLVFFANLFIIDLALFMLSTFSFETHYFYILISNIALALVFFAFYYLNKIFGIILYYIFVLLFIILSIAEVSIYKIYQSFMPIISAITNVENLTEHYGNEFRQVIFYFLPLIIIGIIFYIISIIFTINLLILLKKGQSDGSKNYKKAIVTFLIGVILFCVSFLFIDKSSDFSTNVKNYGLKSALLMNFDNKNSNLNISNNVLDNVSYNIEDYNVLNIDYENLNTENVKENYKVVNHYVATTKPSEKNEYTGLFKGKNLIMIVAESFSHHVIDKELTPTLYRLTNNGFRFTNYYVPFWGGSTTSGEFSFLTGLIPSNPIQSMKDTIGKKMCFTLPNMLKKEGYVTGAYHNGNYKYYDRNLTHNENLGFDYYIANGSGLEELAGMSWPSDRILIEKTFDQYKDMSPFCIYYLTLSGHAFYNDSSSFKVTAYIDKVKARYGDKYPEQVNNYICYQLYLEEGLDLLIRMLEKNNLLDDTVICMTADHYPYGLNSATFTNGINYLPFLYDNEIYDILEMDRNQPIIWSGCLEKEYKDLVKTIDKPVSTIDMLPTLLNLFGASFDSRLLPGRDVMSKKEPCVIYNTGSFIIEEGRYIDSSKEFIPNEGVTVNDDLINEKKDYVNNKISFSSFILDENYYDYIFNNKNVLDDIKKIFNYSK